MIQLKIVASSTCMMNTVTSDRHTNKNIENPV